MSNLDLETLLASAPGARVAGVCIGRVVRVDDEGCAWVAFDGQEGGPARARATVEVSRPEAEAEPARVLLVFERGDPNLPIVLGVVCDTLCTPVTFTAEAAKPPEVRVDGRRIDFEAAEQIVLRCGRGSITLRADGKIVVKGTHLISRSSGTHTIQGATVRIN